MRWFRRRRSRGEREREIDEELSFHREQYLADLVARGVAPAEARRRVRLELGGPVQAKEACREALRAVWLDELLADLRYAGRTLRRSPGFAAAAVLSIGLSVGTVAVVYAAVRAVLLDPLPYARPEELVQIGTDIRHAPRSAGDYVFARDAQEIARRTRTLGAPGLYGNAVLDLAGEGGALPEALYGLRISANLFPVLGIAPWLGRNLRSEEDQPGGPNVVLLSYGLWMRRFGGDPGILGRRLRLNGQAHTIIGVMPPGFSFPLRRQAARTPYAYVEFWAPLRIDPAAPPPGALGGVARLRPGVTMAEAAADLATISAALAREFPAMNAERTHRLGGLRERTLRSAGEGLRLLAGGAGLFLLIGCANVANLLLARGITRRREIAVRVALGAGRARIIRQLLTESALLAVLGGTAGYAFAAAAWQVLPSLVPAAIPRLASARADGGVLAFALAAAVGTGLLFGLAPAIRTAGARTSGRSRLQNALIAGEVAVTVLLVALAAQLGGRLMALLATETGFDAGRVRAAVVLPARERYPDPEARARVYGRFLAAVREIPGVERAGTVDALPFSGENTGGFVSIHAMAPFEAAHQVLAEIDVAGGDYLQAMGVRLIEGRWFRESESGTAILDEGLAHRLWPEGGAIGRRVCIFCTRERPDRWRRVVGVVTGMRHASLEGAGPHFGVYLAENALARAAFLVVRSERPAGELDREIRAAVAAVDPEQPVLLTASLQGLVEESVADRRFLAGLLTVTGGLALALAAAGVYGVAVFLTAWRTREFGVRMALGASPGAIAGLVLRQGARSVIAGLALGVPAALLLMRALRSHVSGFERFDATPAGAAALTVLAAALAAFWLPARRAARIDPAAALRRD